jgi:threonine synthase
MKAKAIMVASSGNMAASCAAYAAKAGLPCYVLVPENTPVGKMSQMLTYGAHVMKIRGDYSDCVDIVQKVAPEHGFYLAGDYVFRREGQKSLAYELCEDFEFRAPDVVVCPTGAGTHISGIWKGFVEYQRLGLVQNLPKMILVQAEGCSPIVEAFEKKRKKFQRWGETKTVCSAVAVADPADGEMALRVVLDSKGFALSISDDEALTAQKWLASTEALFNEPSSALGVAALSHLLKKGVVKKSDRIVCIGTGNGLKDPLTPLQHLPAPVVLDANHEVVSRYLVAHIRKEHPF